MCYESDLSCSPASPWRMMLFFPPRCTSYRIICCYLKHLPAFLFQSVGEFIDFFLLLPGQKKNLHIETICFQGDRKKKTTSGSLCTYWIFSDEFLLLSSVIESQIGMEIIFQFRFYS